MKAINHSVIYKKNSKNVSNIDLLQFHEFFKNILLISVYYEGNDEYDKGRF